MVKTLLIKILVSLLVLGFSTSLSFAKYDWEEDNGHDVSTTVPTYPTNRTRVSPPSTISRENDATARRSFEDEIEQRDYPIVSAASKKMGINELTNDLVEGPMTFLRDIVSDICYVLGFALIVIGLYQYRRHRMNPVEFPISTPIMTVTIGIVLVLLPFTYNILQQLGGSIVTG